jgi:hypothetical protein
MRCEQCQTEIDATSKICPQCGHSVSTVEVLTPEAREDFQGLTLETPGNGGARQDDYSYEYHEPQKGVYAREFNFNTAKGGMLGRIIVGLFVAGLLFLVFPMLFVFLVVIVLGGFGSFLLRRR